jgi:hypothetical protein
MLRHSAPAQAIRTHGSLYSSSIHLSHQDSLIYTQFFRIHLSSISSSIHCRAHLSLYLNISIWHAQVIRTHGHLYSSSIHPSHQDSLIYTQFFRIHLSSISSSIHCRAHLSLYLNISIWHLILKYLLKRI